MQFHLLRRHIEFGIVCRLHQHLFQPRNREYIFDVVVVEDEHQFRRECPHAVVHHHEVIQVERHAVVDIVERVIEVNRSLRRELRRQPHIVSLRKRVLRLLQQVVAERTKSIVMELGVGICSCEVDGAFRPLETVVSVAIEQLPLCMGEVEERRAVRFDVIQRQYVKVDVGDLAVSIRHFVTQHAFSLKPVESRHFAHHHEQIIRRGVAVGRAAGEFAEEEDVFGIEISVGKVSNDSGGFRRIIWQLGGIGRLSRCLGCRRDLRCSYRFGNYGLRRLLLHDVSIRFHFD